MNTYVKFAPNVFVAKCEEQHEKGEVIDVTTKYGKENECIVFNLIGKRDGFYYYSIVRADGFNVQEWAKSKAEKRKEWAASAEKKSTEYFERSNKDREFLSLGEPIKVGHRSEKRHRRMIEEVHNNMGKCVEYKPSRSECLRDYEVNIQFLSIGCIIRVGCKSVPFTSIKEGMIALNEYVEKPYETRQIWEEKFQKGE